ncbi:XRE family transcriptional regulator [Achromobacter spanius]|uniref:XRE family transcriptional regulator n=1 Tax=Achromobacter spanius TaxID=217203 RepID=A0A2S5GI02_9BURK|nr:XRE family transcriptional regulator [Achromobacter spanius]
MDTATDLIKRLRASGMTQSEISRRTGIPQPRLSRWEAGAPSAGANDALRLAELVRSLPLPDVVADEARAAQPAQQVASHA